MDAFSLAQMASLLAEAWPQPQSAQEADANKSAAPSAALHGSASNGQDLKEGAVVPQAAAAGVSAAEREAIKKSGKQTTLDWQKAEGVKTRSLPVAVHWRQFTGAHGQLKYGRRRKKRGRLPSRVRTCCLPSGWE
jgi:hypothetical protein